MELAGLLLSVALALLILLVVVAGSLWWGRSRWDRATEMIAAAVCALTAGGIPLLMLLPALWGTTFLFFMVVLPALTSDGSQGGFFLQDPPPFWVGLCMLATLCAFLAWHLPLLLSVALVGMRGARLPRLWTLGTLLLGAGWLLVLPVWLLSAFELKGSYDMALPLVLAPYALAELALGGQFVLMSLPMRQPSPI